MLDQYAVPSEIRIRFSLPFISIWPEAHSDHVCNHFIHASKSVLG